MDERRSPRQFRSISDLRFEIESTLQDVLHGTERCALFGFPDHSNVGDSAIWLGELAYLSERNIDLTYTCSARTYRERSLRQAVGGGTILLSGGGNFGDVWLRYHSLVLEVIKRHYDSPIVVMPQSIRFRDPDVLQRTKEVLSKHGGVTLLVRDRESLRVATEELECRVRLCPDIALWLEIEPPDESDASTDVLFLRRDDREARREGVSELPEGTVATDWVSLRPNTTLRKARYGATTRIYHWLRETNYSSGPQRHAIEMGMAMTRRSLARTRLGLGLHLLAGAKAVVTDRLHGYLLSMLLGKRGVLLDNSYGKLSSFYATWMQDMKGFQWASSPSDGLELAKELADAHMDQR